MRDIWRLFTGDLRRLTRNTVTIVTIVGLIVIPSIFSWYNILACWNVFDNTGNLKVAVANVDEGYTGDLLPVEVNVGEEVVSALRANDQLEWVITDEADALDGAQSGRYYAAVVIPPSFSRDMMSFSTSDAEQATINYYTNEKKNAIAPKVTDQGADRVSSQVNQVFTETLAKVALGLSSTVLAYADEADADGSLARLGEHFEQVGDDLARWSSILKTYAALVDSSRTLLGDSSALLLQAQASARSLGGTVADMHQSTQGASSALEGAAGRLSGVVSAQAGKITTLQGTVEGAFADASSVAEHSASLIDDAAKMLEAAGDTEAAQTLRQRAQDVRTRQSEQQAAREQALDRVRAAKDSLAQAESSLDARLSPAVDELATTVSDASASLEATAQTLDGVATDLSNTAGSLNEKLAGSHEKLVDASAKLDDAAARLRTLGNDVKQAMASGDVEKLRNIIGSDPASLSQALSAPVQLERHAVYPVENFGSAMTPLYTTLALWIGALLMMVSLRVVPSARTLDELGNPSARSVFLGRFGVISIISLLQSTCVSVGNMLFLGVQVANPLLYLICYWVSGLTFAFMIYTLVALFANLGKAIGVVLLIVQVCGGGGSFPLALLPSFFQNISPYLPITHAVNAMRAAMFGVYAGDFWMEIGTLVLFAIPFLVLGLVLNKPLSYIVPKFVAKVEQTKLM